MDSWEKTEELFHAACDLEPQARDAFLDSTCSEDPSLRQEVERLLAGLHKHVDIIDHPPTQDVLRVIASDRDDSLVGQMISQYKIIARLGEGGMGEVYLAEDTRLDRKVALKVLPRFLTQDEDQVRRLQLEARAASALNHPNLITVHDIGQTDSLHFMAMEFILGRTIRQLIRAGRVPLRQALDVVIQATSGLAAAHQAGIIHRDMKPENMMLRDDGYVKVLDFGIAKLKEPEPPPPESHGKGGREYTRKHSALWGTVSYMSPEQVKGEQIDHQTDLFSLGVVLYELATGQRPFQGDSPDDIMNAVVNDEPPPITDYRSNAPPILKDIITRALNKNREERYQSALDLRRDLQRTLNELVGSVQQERKRAVQIPPKTSIGSWLKHVHLVVGRVRRREELSRRSLETDGAFRGLVAFEESDRDCFFGRDEDISALLEMVTRRDFRFGLLYGRSGCGKTSLLTAGLIPELKDRGWVPLYCRSYKDPSLSVIQECRRLGGISDPGCDEPIEYLDRLGKQLRCPIIIIFDQFEEFLVNVKSAERRNPFLSFVEECYRRTDPGTKLLFSFREDFLARISSLFERRIPEPLMGNKRYQLNDLSEDQAEQIIEKSAGAAALPVSSALCRRVAGDLAEDGRVLASELQIVGLQLQRHGIYTEEAYTRARGKEELLFSYLDREVQRTDDPEAARSILHGLISDENTRVTLPPNELVRRTRLDEKTTGRVLEQLVDLKLVRDIEEEIPPRYELMHEYLISPINQMRVGSVDATKRANRKLRQHLANYALDPRHRIPIKDVLLIRRFSDLERGENAEELLRKSRRSGVMKSTVLFFLLFAGVIFATALASRSEQWEMVTLRDGHTAAANRAVFSPDGRLLVSAGEDGKVIVWDFARRERLATFTDHQGWVGALDFSPDGKWFATGGYDHRVIVWDAQRLEKVAVLDGHQSLISSLVFSPPDAKSLATSSLGDRTIIWEVGQWRKLRELPVGTSEHTAILFSPDGRQLLLRHETRDLTTGHSVASYDEKNWGWAALSPDAARMVSIDPSGIVTFWDTSQFWDMKRLKTTSSDPVHRMHGRAVSFSPDGRLVATGAEDIVLWSAVTEEKLLRLGYSAEVWSLAFSPDGRWLASTHADGAILIWDVAEREQLANFNEHAASVRAVAYSPDGNLLASASEDRSVIIWNTQTHLKEAVLIGHNTRVTAVAFSPDGSWVASSDQNGIVIAWDLAARRPRWISKPAAEAKVSYCVAISPDGRRVVSSQGVYDSVNGHATIAVGASRESWDSISSIYGIAFSPSGRWLVYPTTNGDVVLRDTEKWQVAERLKINNTSFISINFSPDGVQFVTGDDQGKVQLWGVSPLRHIAVVGQHAARVKSVAFSPDGTEVASASDDKTIALWSVGGKKLITQIGTHAAPVLSVAFSPDGKRLVSGEHDRSVRLYTRNKTLWGYRADWFPF